MDFPEQNLREEVARAGGRITMTMGELCERFAVDRESEEGRTAIGLLLASSGLNLEELGVVGQEEIVVVRPQPETSLKQPLTAAPQVAPGDRETSGAAIASLALAIFGTAVIAVVLGEIAKNEIERSEGALKGSGLANAGIILGWIQTAVYVLLYLAATGQL